MIIPTSIHNRLVHLERAFHMLTVDSPGGTLLVSDELVLNIGQTLEDLKLVHKELIEANRDWREKARLRREASNILSMGIRQFWTGLRNMQTRLNLPPTFFAYYKLPLRHNPRGNHRANDWLLLGRNLVEGETAAVVAGFPPMANPSVEELSALLATAEGAGKAYDEAAVFLKEVQARQRKHSEDSKEILFRLAYALRGEFRGKAPSVRRDFMRSFGFRFAPGSGFQEPDLQDPPATEEDPIPDPDPLGVGRGEPGLA